MQQQVTIYLWVKGQGWRPFAYPSDEAAREIKQRSITIGDEASIGDRATIGDEASIGDRATIGDGASIGYRATIGDEASIGDRATIGDGASIGDRATIGDEASISYRATIGDGASIGDGAKINKTLFITGSRNTVNYYGTGVIHIGCIIKTIAEWQSDYEMVGKENDYTAEQIQEYRGYIEMIAELHKTWNIEVPANEN